MSRMSKTKVIYCPCNARLRCYGYMVNATINCDKCENSFVLTEEIWDSSYEQFINNCPDCNKNVFMNVLSHTENKLLIQCVICKKEQSIPLKNFQPI